MAMMAASAAVTRTMAIVVARATAFIIALIVALAVSAPVLLFLTVPVIIVVMIATIIVAATAVLFGFEILLFLPATSVDVMQVGMSIGRNGRLRYIE